jgi:hypothetical protein
MKINFDTLKQPNFTESLRTHNFSKFRRHWGSTLGYNKNWDSDELPEIIFYVRTFVFFLV